MEITDLDSGERMLIYRRRHGQSQREAADEYGVSFYRYRQMEAGDVPCRPPPLGTLQDHERFFICRKRSGLSVREMAKRLGVSGFWVSQMELGRAPIKRLARYWSKAC